MNERRKVVVIGGGFGGLSAAQHLNSNLVDVTLIDRRNYHLFQPLLYQVATGSLSPGEIASPLRSVLSRHKNTRVWLGTVVDVDPDLKRVILADGTIVPYDSLIIAAGSETSYFGHSDWQQWAPGLKSIKKPRRSDIRFCTPSKWPSASRILNSAAPGLHSSLWERGRPAWNFPAPSPRSRAKP